MSSKRWSTIVEVVQEPRGRVPAIGLVAERVRGVAVETVIVVVVGVGIVSARVRVSVGVGAIAAEA